MVVGMELRPLSYSKELGQGVLQGMVDGSASKPALRQDTGYMVEKTYYDIAQYLGAFGAYLMPSFWSKTTPTDYIVEKTYHLAQYLGPFGAYFMPQGPKYGSK